MRSYKKTIPGADLVFQPSDLAEYADDEWDVRVSIGDAPLEEAFYITIPDSQATNASVRELLEKWVFNPTCADRLDLADNPDLPFLQQELMLYSDNAGVGLLELNYYVNLNPMPGPIDLDKPAESLLSVCTYHDLSHDYRVLDLVLEASVPGVDQENRDMLRAHFGSYFMLLLLNYCHSMGEKVLHEFYQHRAIQSLFVGLEDPQFDHVHQILQHLQQQGFIVIHTVDNMSQESENQTSEIVFTDQGLGAVDSIRETYEHNLARYSQFSRVSVAPPALGVPGGFDVRVQMMEYEEVPYEMAIVIDILGGNQEEYFSPEYWFEAFENFEVADILNEVLAFKTNFPAETLDALKTLAENGS